MFCSKCGKEINDAALICPACGCATSNYTQPTVQHQVTASADYPAIKEFDSQASTIKTLGIFAAILMFGIGFIFSIIIKVKSSGIVIPQVTTTDPKEIAMLEEAKRKLDVGNRLAALPLIAIGICIIIVTISVAASQM